MNKLTYPHLAILALLLCTIACVAQTASVSPTATPTYSVGNETPKIGESVTITGDVYIRDIYDVRTGGALLEGTIIHAVCDGEWCYIKGTIYKVFRGCTSHADGRGCQNEK